MLNGVKKHNAVIFSHARDNPKIHPPRKILALRNQNKSTHSICKTHNILILK